MNRRIVIVGGLVVLLCVVIVGAAIAFFALRRPEVIEEVAALPGVVAQPETGVTLPPGDVETQMAIVSQQVSDLRELAPTGEVTKSFMNETELRARLEADFEEDYSPEEARDDALVLSVFDFLSPDVDLYHLYLDLYAEQIAGFYDTEDKQFFLISSRSTLGSFERLIFAHEYTHALQDQQFDLESYDRDTLSDENADAALALSALIEGDAQLLTGLYFAEFYTSEDRAALFEELDEIDSVILDSSPAIIQRDLGFPYEEGNTFVTALYDEGGWGLVDDAYADPPTSTEQILHPSRYLNREEPQPVALEPALDALGAGWRQVGESTFGEFYLRVYLGQQLDPALVDTAADGWGGDRYAVFQQEQTGQLALVFRLAWDTLVDADEFAEAYRQYGTGRSGREPTIARPDLTCWTAQDYVCVAQSGSETWVLLGPNRPTVNGLLTQYQIAS